MGKKIILIIAFLAIFILIILSFFIFSDKEDNSVKSPYYKISDSDLKNKEAGFNTLPNDDPIFNDNVEISYNKIYDNYPKRIDFKEGLYLEGDKNILNKANIFFDDYKNVLGINYDDLVIENTVGSKNVESISYSQKYNDIPVYNSNTVFVASEDKVIHFGTNYVHDMDVDINPKIDIKNAENIAKDLINGKEEIEKSTLMIYPDSNVEGNGLLTYKIDMPLVKKDSLQYNPLMVDENKNKVNALNGREVNDYIKPSVFVDAATGKVVKIVDNIRSQTVYGNIYGYVVPDHMNQPRVIRNFSNEYVNSGQYSTLSDKDGKYSLEVGTNEYVNSSFNGSFVKVNNVAQPNSLANVVVQSGVADINWTIYDNSYKQEESNVFYHTNFIHDFFASGKLPFNVSGLDFNMVANVEVDGECNAFADGSSINFFKAVEGCEALSLSSDVIYHEYTHNMVFDVAPTLSGVYWGETGNMNEGYADYYACSINNNTCLADNFFSRYDFDCLRNCKNTKIYPQDYAEEPHYAAEIISGSIWDLREKVGSEIADSLALLALSYDPQTFEELLDYFILSDDARYGNANLNDGTPHAKDICDSFYTNHGIYSNYCFDVLSLVSRMNMPKVVHGPSINIVGSAGGTDFKNYEIYLSGNGAASKLNCDSLIPVENSILCSNIDISSLDSGEYVITLRVYDTSNNINEYFININIRQSEIFNVGQGDNKNYIKGRMPVNGSIYIKDYNRYDVEYRRYGEKNWNTGCSGEGSSQILCNIDVSSFQDGKYSLRISANYTDKTLHSDPFSVFVLNSLLTNGPIELQSFPKGQINYGINQNDVRIIFPSFGNCDYVSDSVEKYTLSNHTSNFMNLNQRDFVNTYNDKRNMACGGTNLIVCNTTKCDKLDRISNGTNDYYVPYDDAPAIYNYRGNDNIASVSEFSYYNSKNGIFDFRGKILEMWPEVTGNSLVASEKKFFGSNINPFSRDIYLNAFNEKGMNLEGFPINTIEGAEGYLVHKMPILVENDKVAMIAGVFDPNNLRGNFYNLSLNIYSVNGVLINRSEIFMGSSRNESINDLDFVSGDINNDGQQEIIVAFDIVDFDLYQIDKYDANTYKTLVYVFDKEGNLINKIFETKGLTFNKLVLGKTDNGVLIPVIALDTTWATQFDSGLKVIGLDSNGKQIINFTLEDINELINGLVMGDVNGDSKSEIIVNYRPRWYGGSDSGIIVFNNSGSVINKIKLGTLGEVDDFWHFDPILLDFNSDGNIDLIQESLYIDNEGIWKTHVFAINLGGEYNKSRIDWAQYRHDPQHTGCYDCNISIAPSVCGNSNIEKGEECDDGNIINGDGCNSTCKKENVININCTDYDGYNSANASRVKYNELIYNDECISYNQVKEYYCEYNIYSKSYEMKSSIIECENSCFEGACVQDEAVYKKCTDNDALNDMTVKGEVNSLGQIYADNCEERGLSVRQYFCVGDKLRNFVKRCPAGTYCSEGKCL